MRVLYIVSAYPRFRGDVITPWMGELIRRLKQRRVEVEVLAPSYLGSGTHDHDGVTVHRYRYAPRVWETLTHDQTAPDRIRDRPWFAGLVPLYVAAGSLAAARLARTGRYDLVHTFWPLPHGIHGLAARYAGGIPLVTTFFGVELRWMRSRLPFLAPVLRHIVRRSDAVTVISSDTAAELRASVPGVRPERIPFGPAVEVQDPDPPPPPAPPAADQPFRLLFVGRLVERKGVHVLVNAMQRLALDARITLDVVGDGPERHPLQVQTEEAGLQDQVRFHGFVPRVDLEDHLGACDALVLPAVVDSKGDTEGLGVVLLEAMSFAKPVIASATGGIVDVVQHERNGLLVPPGDADALAAAIRELDQGPDTRWRLGRQGWADVQERFSWAAIIERVTELYQGLRRRAV